MERTGASAIVADILDARAVEAAAKGCDALVHVSANTSGRGGPAEVERVRVEGCRSLLAAARAQGARRLVVGSGYWVYADSPSTISEDSPLDPRGESLTNRRAEEVALAADGKGSLDVIAVRPGMVYGDGSWFRSVFDAVMAGSYRYIGEGRNPWSFVSVGDAGRGFARVLESGVAGEVYNLVDGRPVAWREFADLVAERTSRPPPTSISPSDAETLYGPDVAYHLRARRACSAAKIEGLGWRPNLPDVRAGLNALLPEMSQGSPRPRGH